MALRFVNEPGLGGRVGQAIGTGLGSGLNVLLNQQMQKMQAQKLEQGGLPSVLAHLDPQVQAAYLREYGAAQQLNKQQELESQAYQNVESELANMAQQGGFTQQEQQEVDNLIPDTAGARNQQVLEKDAQRASISFQPTREKELANRIAAMEKSLQKKDLHPAQARVIRKDLAEQQKMLDKISQKNFDATQKLTDEIENEARQSREALDVIERQRELIEKGNMTSPGNLAFLKGIGLDDIDSLKAGDTQEFIKNNGFFLKNLKTLFGGRITDAEMRQYMRTIANEWQSPEGMRRVLLGMEKANRAAIARADAYDQILEDNAGIPPRDLNRRVNRLVKPELDRLAREWKKDLEEKEYPEQESSYGAAAKTLVGKGLGKLGSITGPAVLGGLAGGALGSILPGPGTVAGASLGARAGLGAGGLAEILNMLRGQ